MAARPRKQQGMRLKCQMNREEPGCQYAHAASKRMTASNAPMRPTAGDSALWGNLTSYPGTGRNAVRVVARQTETQWIH